MRSVQESLREVDAANHYEGLHQHTLETKSADIDNNAGKPANVDPEHWKTLVGMRATEAAQVKSEHMRAISKGKGSTTTQMKAIEREVVSRLVSHPPLYVVTDVLNDVIQSKNQGCPSCMKFG